MKLWKLVCPVGLIFVLGACSNLKQKAVVMGGDVQGLKVTMDVNANSGSPTPLPKIETGLGSFYFVDIPVDSGTSLEYFRQSKSIWSDKAADTTYIKIQGAGAPDSKSTVRFLDK